MSVEHRIHGTLLRLVQGDITRQQVEAVVNAANSSLLGGGGVDGAIHRAGGPAILEECKQIHARQGGCPTGEAVITTAGNLPAKRVIHTVGPIWRGGRAGEPRLLANCYRNSLELAVEHGLQTVAFPSVSTGAYGYPVDQAARVALGTVIQFLEADAPLDEVRFVLYDSRTYQAYETALTELVEE